MASLGLALAFFGALAVAFVSNVLLFGFARRWAPHARRARAHAFGVAGALLVFTAILASFFARPGLVLLPGWIMTICNAYILFHLDNMAETARRIRLLRELHARPDGMARASLLAAYPPQEVFDRRISRLLLAGQCIEAEGRLRITGRGYLGAAVIIGAFRKLVFPE